MPMTDVSHPQTNFDNTGDQEIQAWPQPSPIAYPDRKEMLTSPAPLSANNQNSTPESEVFSALHKD